MHFTASYVPERHTPPAAAGPAQVACEPQAGIGVVVEQYSPGGEGQLRLHLEQVRPAAYRGRALCSRGCLPSQQLGADARGGAAAWPCLQVGGSGGVEALWARTTTASSTSALEAGLQPGWRQLSNVNGTASWELRCAAAGLGAAAWMPARPLHV